VAAALHPSALQEYNEVLEDSYPELQDSTTEGPGQQHDAEGYAGELGGVEGVGAGVGTAAGWLYIR
jgi:hypothetical protein